MLQALTFASDGKKIQRKSPYFLFVDRKGKMVKRLERKMWP